MQLLSSLMSLVTLCVVVVRLVLPLLLSLLVMKLVPVCSMASGAPRLRVSDVIRLCRFCLVV